MTLDNYLTNRKSLLKKVCYRAYICGDTVKMIIVNINNQTTAFLDGISAVFFQILADKSQIEIKDFAIQNELTIQDIEEFIVELYENGIIGRQENLESVIENTIGEDLDKKDMIEFGDKLYHYGYLFSAHIDITYDCNLRCLHCYHTFDEYKRKEVMTLNEIKKFIDDIYELGAFSVTLSGGEILLRKDFKEIVEYITKKGMIIYLLTNGTLIDEKIIAIINNCNIQKIGISLYSIEESIHDKITQLKGSCKKTKLALQKLKSTDVMIAINCVLMKSNFEQYKMMDEYCKKNNFSLVLDTSMIPKLDGNKEPISLGLSY